jgi:hypothetical protein
MTPLQRVNQWRKNFIQNIGRAPEQISELIGRVFYQVRYQPPQRITVDYTEPDYEFWDKLRYGKQYGYEIGGLFARPITEIIAAWVMGDGFTADTENDDTNQAIEDFLAKYLQLLIEVYQDSLALGNSYLVINADGTLTLVPAAMVDIETNPLNFRELTKVTIKTLDQENGVTIEDEYTATQRTIRVRQSSSRDRTRNQVSREQTFPNTIGRIPVIHFANDRTANEALGRPYFEPLLTLFAEYDDVIRKGLDGVKIMGNPIPVVSGVQDAGSVQADFNQYSQTHDDHRGVSQNNDVAELSPTEIFFTSGSFDFKAPGNFTPNTTDMLKKLFQVMLQHSQIPEWAWGGAISSSMASVQAQMPAFVKFINGRRRKIEQNLKEVLEIYLAVIAQFTPGIVLPDNLKLEWSELVPDDKDIQLKWVQFLRADGSMTRETALRLSDTVENVSDEVANAQAEHEADEAKAQANIEAELDRMMADRENRLSTENADSDMPMEDDNADTEKPDNMMELFSANGHKELVA